MNALCDVQETTAGASAHSILKEFLDSGIREQTRASRALSQFVRKLDFDHGHGFILMLQP